MKTLTTLLSLFVAFTTLHSQVIPTDFNHDGHPDLVIHNRSTRQTGIWYLNNNTRIASRFGPTLPSGWNLITEADFNGDGKPDYLLYNPSTHQSAIWYLNNNIFTGQAAGPTIPAGWLPASVADFNLDGKPDVVLYNPATNQTVVWYLNNNTFVSGGYAPTLTGGYLLVSAAGDFNHDGKPDFLLYNPATHRSAIWFLNNRTYIGGANGPTLPASYTLDDLADFNHDGRPDYLLNADRVTALWYLNGNVLLGSAYGPTITQGWSLAAASAKPCTFSVAPHSAHFPINGHAGNNIYVSTLQFGCTWTAQVISGASFIHITRGGGTNVGSTFITYTVDANMTGQPRNGAIKVAGVTVAISQDGPFNWNGTWSGTLNTNWTAGSCSLNRTVNFSMTITTSGNSVSGPATLDGAPCFDLNTCSVNDFPNSSGTVSGSVSGSTINVTYDGTASGGVCNGDSFSVSFDGTGSGNTITGSSPNVSLTRH